MLPGRRRIPVGPGRVVSFRVSFRMAVESTPQTAVEPAAPPPSPPLGAGPGAPQLPKPKPPTEVPLPEQRDYFAMVLSYLIPGLGQVYQGRIGKGLLFFFSLYALFFYGQWMGQWRNVWLPDATDLPRSDISLRGVFTWNLEGVPKALSYRPQFLAQFWMGVASWPAIVQYRTYTPANAGPAPVIGTYQRTPPEEELNKLQRDGNKRWDLGWVFTVIAGVLNLLVIYDAFAGPMFRDPPKPSKNAAPHDAGTSAPPHEPPPEPLAP